MKLISAIATAAIALATAAHAGPVNLVQNGGFEAFVTGGLGQFGTQFPVNQLVGWDTTGYNFTFDGNAPTAAVDGKFGPLRLWGALPDGTSNGITASPDGGNFVGLDGAFDGFGNSPTGVPVTQTIAGLTAGARYAVSFYWALAQQDPFVGDTTGQIAVTFGDATQSTVVKSQVSQGFTPWALETFTFTATSTSQVLSFLGIGTPQGVPPFELLDGVSVFAVDTVPEPAMLGLMGLGLVGLAGLRRRK